MTAVAVANLIVSSIILLVIIVVIYISGKEFTHLSSIASKMGFGRKLLGHPSKRDKQHTVTRGYTALRD